MKISKTQQDIIDKMTNGWELGLSMGLSGGFWIQQGGLGKGGTSQTVSRGTIRALLNKKLVVFDKWDYPARRLILAP